MSGTLTRNQLTRLSGFFYLMVVLTGIFSLMYVPMQIIEMEDPGQTVANLLERKQLFRFGIASTLLCYLFFLFLGWSLFKLLKPVNRDVAFLMISLVLCSLPVAVFSSHYLVYILSILEETRYVVGTASEIEREVMNAIQAYSDGLFVADLFWSTWLFPFGYLVFRSGFLPRWLGILLMVGSAAYFVTFLLLVLYPESFLIRYLDVAPSVAEIGTCLWLLIVGSKKET